MTKSQICLGLSYGDEGKGIAVDNLCKMAQDKGESTIVVRFSGGHQCGHDVHYDENLSHVFGSYGSGTLRGVPSFFTEHTLMYLPRLVGEYEALMAKGVSPCLSIHGNAKVTTPFDVVFGRLVEERNRHGSVGIGIGATMHRNLTTGYKLNVVDFMSKHALNHKMNNIYKWYSRRAKDELGVLPKDFARKCEKHAEAFSELQDEWEDYFHIQTNYSMIAAYDTAVFEGSQGIMLDMDHGIFPHVTYAHTTSRNAMEVCSKVATQRPEVYYVTRSYFTRHGNGPLPEGMQPIPLTNNHMEKNISHEWQGEFITGKIQPELLNIALSYDAIYSDPCDKNLIVTCLDQNPSFDVDNLVSQLRTRFKRVYVTNSHITKGLWRTATDKSSLQV